MLTAWRLGLILFGFVMATLVAALMPTPIGAAQPHAPFEMVR